MVSEPAKDRITTTAREMLREEIARAQGQEILCTGHRDKQGMVASVEVCARGNDGRVAAACRIADSGDMIIHNHPSGDLRPSDADVEVSARLAEAGLGSAIVDNEVTRIYVTVEPAPTDETHPLDEEYLAGVLSAEGAMASILPEYLERPSQVAMLRDVVQGFNQSGIVVAEAGTGVGKSFAYLLPAVAWASLNRERVVIATATINLQQQLLDKDLVLVQKALGTSEKTALVKGRGNYLCLRRLQDRLQEAELFDEDEEIHAVRDWATSSTTGSRSDLPFFMDNEGWSRINSDADTCSTARCPDRERCFVLRARQRAAGARILVANHHLVFSDLAIRLAGAGWESTAILPPFTRLVLDEAHNLERAATSFFSERVSRYAVRRHVGRLLRTRGPHRFGVLEQLPALGVPTETIKKTEALIAGVKDAVDRLDGELIMFLGNDTTWRMAGPEVERLHQTLGASLLETQQTLLSLATGLSRIIRSADESIREEPPLLDMAGVIRRLEAIAAIYEKFTSLDSDGDRVLWMERHRGRRSGDEGYVALISTPLDIRQLMEDSVFMPQETVVLTSATLTVRESFKFWGERIGVPFDDEATATGVFPSPFDYRRRVLLAVPADAPGPEDTQFVRYLQTLVSRLVGASNGGVLVLFTAYRRLEAVYDVVAPDLERRGYTCYRQGSDDRTRLLESFRTDAASVLFATDSFWEGVDAPGDTLRLVIVCRLPFRVPTDPVQLARAEAVVEAGGNAFFHLSLPQAVMRLKQGFGRLMRRTEDYGAVVIADPRIVRKQYGRVFLESLPPARTLVASGEEIVEEVRSFLTR